MNQPDANNDPQPAPTREELIAAGFELSEAEYALLDRFVTRLLDENTRINLTATREPAAFWGLHVCDSLALLSRLSEFPVKRLIDVGTGGGLPGIVIACVCPEIEVTLLDSTRKKLEALQRVTVDLGLTNCRMAWGRAELLGHDKAYREQFDAASVRAVGELRAVIEYAAPFVRVEGECWFFRSVQAVNDDIDQAQRAAGRYRLSLIEARGYQLPQPHGERALAIYRKDRPLLKSLPRSPGKPKREPL
jgi:16S rRNA (guanine527-N7)-methyltransferase